MLMDTFFKISERGSTVGTEVLGGFTTFLTMAYIIAVNPLILGAAGVPAVAALTATCFGAAVMIIIMGFVANRPVALASGMGVNAVVAYSVCLGGGVDWRVGMAVIFVEGIIITALVLLGLRKAVMDAIPASLRLAIGIGIGLFIAFIGLKGGGIVVMNESTLVSIGDFTSPMCIVALVSLGVAIVLQVLNVRGGLLISIVAGVIIGIPLGVTPMPSSWVPSLSFETFFAPFQVDPNSGVLAISLVFMKPAMLMFVFAILMSDFFDTMGTILGIGKAGDFIDENGQVENTQEILLVDSTAAAVGGLIGASSITTYVESISGVAAGARTGLANLVTGACFIVAAFLSPFVEMVTGASTCGTLVVVGCLMIMTIADIEWQDPVQAFPAAITILTIPLTYSITDGIGLGFITYCLIMIFTGRAREVKPLMWIVTVAFLLLFIFA